MENTCISVLNVNSFLKFFYQDCKATIYRMSDKDGCYEELFGSLVGHQKKEGVNGIPALATLVTEKNLVFDSGDTGVEYLKSQFALGTLAKERWYFFLFITKEKEIKVMRVFFGLSGLREFEEPLSDEYRWCAENTYSIVVPAIKTSNTQK